MTPQGLGLSQGMVTPSIVTEFRTGRKMSYAMRFAAGGQGRGEVNRPAKVTTGGAGAGDYTS